MFVSNPEAAMNDKLNLDSPEFDEKTRRKRRTGLRVIVLSILVALVALANYLDLDALFKTPDNVAQVQIPEQTGQTAPDTGATQPSGSGQLPDSGQYSPPQDGGAAGQPAVNATRAANATSGAGEGGLAETGDGELPAANGTSPASANATAGETPPPDVQSHDAQSHDAQPHEPTVVDLGNGRSAEVGAVIPLLRADSTVTPRFITDLAAYLVNGYYPKGTHPAAANRGVTTISLQALNLRYGGALVGLNQPLDDAAEHRRYVLRYVLMPSMINALYNLYADSFENSLALQAAELERTRANGETSKLSKAEQAELFSIYANGARTLAAVLHACAADREISRQMQAYWRAEKAAMNCDEAFRNAIQAQELARETGQDLGAAKTAAEQAGNAYRNAIMAREQARSDLVTILRGHPGVRGLGDDQMLFAVSWVERRLFEIPNSLDAITALGNIMDNMAARLEARGD